MSLNTKFALGKDVFANVNVWQGVPLVHLRYHKTIDHPTDPGRVLNLPTKRGVTLSAEQMCKLLTHLPSIISELETAVEVVQKQTSVPSTTPTLNNGVCSTPKKKRPTTLELYSVDGASKQQSTYSQDLTTRRPFADLTPRRSYPPELKRRLSLAPKKTEALLDRIMSVTQGDMKQEL